MRASNMGYYLKHFKPILQNVIGILILYKGVDTRSNTIVI